MKFYKYSTQALDVLILEAIDGSGDEGLTLKQAGNIARDQGLPPSMGRSSIRRLALFERVHYSASTGKITAHRTAGANHE